MPRILFILLFSYSCFFASAQCPNLVISASQVSYCHSDSVKLTASNVPGTATVEWNYGLGFDTGTSNYAFVSSVYNYINVNLRLTLSNGMVCNYSVDSITFIRPPLAPQFSASRVKLCTGPDTVVLTDLTPKSANRNWVINGQTFSNKPKTSVISVNSLGLIDISLVVDDSFGCRTVGNFYDTLVVYPDINLDFSNGNPNHCVPYSTSFTASYTGNNINTLNWSFQGADNPSSSAAVVSAVNYRTAGTFDVTLTVTTNNGCVYTLLKEDYIELGQTQNLSISIPKTVGCLSELIRISQTNSVTGAFTWTATPGTIVAKKSNYADVVYRDTGYHDVNYRLNHNGCISQINVDSIIRIRGSKADFSFTDNIYCDTPHIINLINESDTTSAGIGGFVWNIYFSGNDSLFLTSTSKDLTVTLDSFPAILNVELVATDLLGCSDTAFEQDLIRSEPYVIDVRPYPLIACPGSNIIYQNRTKNAAPSSIESYNWTFYTPNFASVHSTSTKKNPGVTYNDTGYYGYKLVVQNTAGCKDSLIADSIIRIAEVSPDFTISDTIICFGDSVLCVANSNPPEADFLYDWTLTDSAGNQISTGNDTTFSASFDLPGIYTMKMRHRVFSYQVMNVCLDSMEKTVYANGAVGNVIIDTNSGCAPLTIQPYFEELINIHQGDTSQALQLNWSIQPNATVVSEATTSANPKFTLYDEDLYKISVFTTNSVGCGFYDEKGANIRVGVLAKFGPPNSSYCLNQHFTLWNRSEGFPTNLQWIVNPPGHHSIDSLDFDNYSIAFDSVGTYEVTLIASKDNQCADTFSHQYSIVPFAADFAVRDSLLECAPQLTEFYNRSTNADSLLWIFGDGNTLLNDTSFVSHTYTTNDSFNVTLIAMNNSGCSDTITKTNAVVINGPKLDVSVANAVGCEQLLVSFIDNSNGADLLFIDYGDGTPLDTGVNWYHQYVVQNGDSVQYYSPTLYGESVNGCMASLRLDSIVKVYSKPLPMLNVMPDTALCLGSELKYNSASGFTDSVKWYLDDVFISSNTSDSTLMNAIGYHQLKLVSRNDYGCVDSIGQEIFIKDIPQLTFDTSYLACYNALFRKEVIASGTPMSANYTWDMGEVSNANNIQSSANAFAEISYQTSGPKRILLDVLFANGCIRSDSSMAFVIGPDSLPNVAINYVTVNNAGGVDIAFNSSNYTYFDSYEFQKNGNFLSSVNSQSTSAIIDPAIVSSGNQYCYSIGVRDICQNSYTNARSHCAVVLSSSSLVHKEILLEWTPYVGWDSVLRYEIYRSTQGSPFGQISSVDGSILQYIDTNLCEDDYSYYVVAIQDNGPYNSKSNTVTQTSLYIPNTLNPSVQLATVNKQENIEVRWRASAYEYPMLYEIKKFENSLGNEVDVFQLTDTFLYDANVITAENNYFYTISEIDQCDNIIMGDRHAKTIVLTGNFENGGIQLRWSDYEQWLNGVDKYEIVVREFGVYNLVTTVGGNTTQYLDKALHQEEANGLYAYKVRAINIDGDTSYSNIIHVGGSPIVFIPNAFSPNKDGINETFKPKMRFTVSSTEDRPTDYELDIYNRWGQLVFHTLNRDDEWDGTYKSEPAQQGVYFYQLKVTDNTGRSYYHKGTVTLLR